MKKLLFIIMLLPVFAIGQPTIDQFSKELKEADSLWISKGYDELNYGSYFTKSKIDTVKIKALCSLNIAFSDSVSSEDRIVSVFSTDLLEVREFSIFNGYKTVKYLSITGKLPISKSLIVWISKEIN